MNNIEFLEHGHPGLTIVWRGETIPLTDPRRVHFQIVLASLMLRFVRGTPTDEGFPDWKRELVFDRWLASWQLPQFEDARRLAYLVDNYADALTNDLALIGFDLGDLWRARRWSLLINLIDHLPSHSWYSAAVANDKEHARLVAEATAARGPSEESKNPGPSLTTWTPEVALLTRLIDAVRRVEYAVVAVQAGSKAGDPPKPSPTPHTEIEEAMRLAEHNRKKTKHQALVARMLPHKANPE